MLFPLVVYVHGAALPLYFIVALPPDFTSSTNAPVESAQVPSIDEPQAAIAKLVPIKVTAKAKFRNLLLLIERS
jgi:hypothetical protein